MRRLTRIPITLLICCSVASCANFQKQKTDSRFLNQKEPLIFNNIFEDVPQIPKSRPITEKDRYGRNFLRYTDSKAKADGITATVQTRTYILANGDRAQASRFYARELARRGWNFQQSTESNNMVFDSYMKPKRSPRDWLNLYYRKYKDSRDLFLTFRVTRYR